jgi:cell division protein FtsQ
MSFAALQTAQIRKTKAEDGRKKSRAILDALWRTAAAAGLSGLIGLGVWQGYRWAQTAPLFALRAIHFNGVEHAHEADLIARSGLKPGENLFKADLLQAARGISANPWVAAVRLDRRWPGTIDVNVQEHRAAALVQAGGLYALDDEGRLFKRVSPDDSLDLPIVSGVGRTGPERELRLLSALHFLDTWRAAGFTTSELSELRLDDEGRVTVFTHDNAEVRLGAKDWPLALRRLASMRAALARRGEHATKIDLDNPARPSEAAATLAEKR